MLICVGRIQESFGLDHNLSIELLDDIQQAYIEPTILNMTFPFTALMDARPTDLDQIKTFGCVEPVTTRAINDSVYRHESTALERYTHAHFLHASNNSQAFMTLLLEYAYRLFLLSCLARGYDTATARQREWGNIYKWSFKKYEPANFIRRRNYPDDQSIEIIWAAMRNELRYTLLKYFRWWLVSIVRVDRDTAFKWLRDKGVPIRYEVLGITYDLFETFKKNDQQSIGQAEINGDSRLEPRTDEELACAKPNDKQGKNEITDREEALEAILGRVQSASFTSTEKKRLKFFCYRLLGYELYDAFGTVFPKSKTYQSQIKENINSEASKRVVRAREIISKKLKLSISREVTHGHLTSLNNFKKYEAQIKKL